MLVVSERPGLPATGFGQLSQQSFYGSPGQGEQSQLASEVASLVASTSLTSTFGARFHPLVDAVRQRFAQDVALLQIWTLINNQTWSSLARRQLTGVVAQTQSNPCTLHDVGLLSFRNKCCKHGIRGPAMGMVGKAWSSGALCVVQNSETLPTMLHPRTKLECTGSIGEIVYIPVFDQAVPCNEVQAVIEVMLAKNARDHMAVANVISFIGSFLGQLQMSLSTAVKQHVPPLMASAFQQHRQPPTPVTKIGQPAGSVAAEALRVEQMPSPTRSLSRSMSRTASIRDLGFLDEQLHHAASA